MLVSKTPQGAAAPVAARAAEVVGVLGPGFEHERKAFEILKLNETNGLNVEKSCPKEKYVEHGCVSHVLR